MCGGSLGGGFFGGASGAEIGAAQQENTFAGLARGYAATNYGEQQQALGYPPTSGVPNSLMMMGCGI